jgi:hypothetical protein
MPAPTNGSLGESTPLLGSRHADEPKWKSYSKRVWHMVWGTLCSNYVNVLLVFVPLGIIAGSMQWSPTAVFILNFIAIMPLAALLSFATEELSAKLGQTLGGLCNATFGNAVELIVSIRADLLRVMEAMAHHRGHLRAFYLGMRNHQNATCVALYAAHVGGGSPGIKCTRCADGPSSSLLHALCPYEVIV